MSGAKTPRPRKPSALWLAEPPALAPVRVNQDEKPLPKAPLGSYWTIVRDAGVIGHHYFVWCLCHCWGQEHPLKKIRRDHVLNLKSRSCGCHRGALRIGMKRSPRHSNGGKSPEKIGESLKASTNPLILKKEIQLETVAHPEAKLSPSIKGALRCKRSSNAAEGKHDPRVVRPGCSCALCGYRRSHWRSPIPQAQSSTKAWNVTLRGHNLTMARGMAVGRNLVFVGGANEIESVDTRESTVREWGGKRRTAAGHSPNVDRDEDEFINRTFQIPDVHERHETPNVVADVSPGKAQEFRVKKFGGIFRILNENDAVIDEFDTEAEAKAEKKELDDQREYEQLEDSPPLEEIDVLDEVMLNEENSHEQRDDRNN
jgi:hypothetical protein